MLIKIGVLVLMGMFALACLANAMSSGLRYKFKEKVLNLVIFVILVLLMIVIGRLF